VYATEHDQHSVDGLGLVAQIRNAIENGELIVHYQPEVDLATVSDCRGQWAFR